MAVAKAEILDAIANMTVLELSQLIKEMEEKFGVSAAAAAVAAPAPAAGAAAAAAEEQTEFTVMLTAVGESKVNVIKVVRAITGLGLERSKRSRGRGAESGQGRYCQSGCRSYSEAAC